VVVVVLVGGGGGVVVVVVAVVVLIVSVVLLVHHSISRSNSSGTESYLPCYNYYRLITHHRVLLVHNLQIPQGR